MNGVKTPKYFWPVLCWLWWLYLLQLGSSSHCDNVYHMELIVWKKENDSHCFFCHFILRSNTPVAHLCTLVLLLEIIAPIKCTRKKWERWLATWFTLLAHFLGEIQALWKHWTNFWWKANHQMLILDHTRKIIMAIKRNQISMIFNFWSSQLVHQAEVVLHFVAGAAPSSHLKIEKWRKASFSAGSHGPQFYSQLAFPSRVNSSQRHSRFQLISIFN